MNRSILASTCIAVAGLVAVAGTLGFGQPEKPKAPGAPGTDKVKTPAQPEGAPQLPKGWTEADMQACMEAGTPGEMHSYLAKGAGTWTGKSTMWMAPDSEAMKSECTSTVTSVMDGRYLKCEITGDMPGMGPFLGQGVYGFDNVSQKFQSTWIDNHSTGMMIGTGDRSADGKVLTWRYTYNCPVTKKQAIMREIETITGPNSKTLEMYGNDPKSGKEFKMMQIEFTRKN